MALISPAEWEERRVEESRALAQMGHGHHTHFGRYDFAYRAAARDMAFSREKKELNILMLGCSTGETALDLAAIFEQTYRSIGKEVRLKITALDIAEPVIDIARNGLYSNPWVKPDPEIYKTAAWVEQREDALIVNWKKLAEQGHEVQYRIFDVSQGLEKLEPLQPFDLTEIINSHHSGKKRDMESIQSVAARDGMILASGSLQDAQAPGVMQKILEDMQDPEVLRFFSGLISVRYEGLTEDDLRQYGDLKIPLVETIDGKWQEAGEKNNYDPLDLKRVVEGAKFLENIWEKSSIPAQGSREEKRIFLRENPLMTVLVKSGAVARNVRLSFAQQRALQFAHQTAPRETRESMEKLYTFAHQEEERLQGKGIPFVPLADRFFQHSQVHRKFP